MADTPTSFMANSIRALAMDAVQQANSGHPARPWHGRHGVALWGVISSTARTNPHWFTGDRFVLVNGHGSMLIYALLHLTVRLPIKGTEEFRQLHSKTPGHPEFGYTPGMETTTGRGPGASANAVAWRWPKTDAAEFNQCHHSIVDHHTLCLHGRRLA